MRILPGLLFLVGLTGESLATFAVGQRDYVFGDTTRGRELAALVWYPADGKAKPGPLAEKGVFLPIVAAVRAPLAKPAAGGFPVVLLSHGSGGLGKRLFWLADALVRKGMVVLAVDHPGNRTGDTSADGALRTWDRAKDLTVALDRLLAHPDFAGRLDAARVAAAGHSAGGTTVLLLAGARLAADRLTSPTPNCAGTKDPYYAKQCEQFTAMNFRAYRKDLVEGDYRDSRIKAVVALDPGFVRSFRVESLRKPATPALVIAADKLATPQDEILSKEFQRYLPADAFFVLPGSFHMTFVTGCKTGLPVDDPELQVLCAGSGSRKRMHEETAERVATFFHHHWTKQL